MMSFTLSISGFICRLTGAYVALCIAVHTFFYKELRLDLSTQSFLAFCDFEQGRQGRVLTDSIHIQ